MKLTFAYPDDKRLLGAILATRAYEDIWREDGARIKRCFERYTDLTFQQREIRVTVHDGQSMSGTADRPMRLSIRNNTLNKKRIALVHELGHRLLSGNGLGAGGDGDSYIREEEKRLYLFLGDVLRYLYGAELYEEWSVPDPAVYHDDHLVPLRFASGFSPAERREMVKRLIATNRLG